MESQNVLKNEKVTIIADTRESSSAVTRILQKMDIVLSKKQLKVADYICSDRVAVERKTVKDFVSSMINQRVFKQAEALKEAYSHPILIIEGDLSSLFNHRNVNENAIRGAMACIAIDYRIPILWAIDARETANMLYRFAWREQKKNNKSLQIRSNKKSKTMNEQQEYLIAGLPNVSNMLSKRLLKHFGSPKAVFIANVDDLQKVDKIGKKKAKQVWDLINSQYQEGQ